jgi:hypothetical protein
MVAAGSRQKAIETRTRMIREWEQKHRRDYSPF